MDKISVINIINKVINILNSDKCDKNYSIKLLEYCITEVKKMKKFIPQKSWKMAYFGGKFFWKKIK